MPHSRNSSPTSVSHVREGGSGEARSDPTPRDRPRRPSAAPRLASVPPAVRHAARYTSEKTRPERRHVRKLRGRSIPVGMGSQLRRKPNRGDTAGEVHTASVAARPKPPPRAGVSRSWVRLAPRAGVSRARRRREVRERASGSFARSRRREREFREREFRAASGSLGANAPGRYSMPTLPTCRSA